MMPLLLYAPRLRTPSLKEPEEKAGFERDGAPGERIGDGRARVFSKSPARGCKVPLGKIPRCRFEGSRERIIPPVEKPEEGDSGYDLQYLIFVEVSSQFSEIGIRHSVWHLTSGLGEPQGSAFGVVAFRALLVLPDGFDLAHPNTP